MVSKSTVDQTLEAREVDGEPFSAITAALEELGDEETLLLVNSFEPDPLYDVLDRRGFRYETSQVDGEWHVKIRHA